MTGNTVNRLSSVTVNVVVRRRSRVRAALRMCLGVVGAALIITGGVFLWRGFRLHAARREAETAEVLDIRVDVGATGRHQAMLKQIAGFTCRQYIRMAPELREGEDAANVLRGLELEISVRDAGGVERMTGAYSTSMAARRRSSRTELTSNLKATSCLNSYIRVTRTEFTGLSFRMGWPSVLGAMIDDPSARVITLRSAAPCYARGDIRVNKVFVSGIAESTLNVLFEVEYAAVRE